jgi:hypothetical protein
VDHDRRDRAYYTWIDGHEHADSPRLDARSVTPKKQNGRNTEVSYR